MRQILPLITALIFIVILAALPHLGGNPKMAVYTEAEIPHGRLGDNITPNHYALDLIIDPSQETFSGRVKMTVDVAQPTRQIYLHAKNITVTDAYLNHGEQIIALQFEPIDLKIAPSGIAKLTADQLIPAGRAEISLVYHAPYNLALSGLYKVTRGDDDYILTQFQAIDARQAFPGFDEPRFKTPFDVTITAPEGLTVYTGTPLISSLEQSRGRVKHIFSRTRPLPTYLLSFGVGPYDVTPIISIPRNEVRTRPLDLRGVTVRGESENMAYALHHTDALLTLFETYFGSPYPYQKLDLIAAPDFAYAAMENPGAILYLEYLLLFDETAPARQKNAYARVHAHELAHQWFGNLVTPRWWDDIWLNESFASWHGNKITDQWQPDGEFARRTLEEALSAMSLDSLSSARAIRQPLARSENVGSQFDAITYRKGGAVLAMFENYLGADMFQNGVRHHINRFTDGVASSEDFFESIAQMSGQDDIVPAMKSFVEQSGLPLVHVSIDCQNEPDCPSPYLRLSQSRFAPLGSPLHEAADERQWHIPLCITLGYELARDKICALMQSEDMRLPLGLGVPDWIMPNGNGAGYYRFALDGQDWAGLMDHLDRLNDRETLSALDSLSAGFQAGSVPPDTYLDGLSRFADLTDAQIKIAVADAINDIAQILPVEDKAAWQNLARFTDALFLSELEEASVVKDYTIRPDIAQSLLDYGANTRLKSDFARAGSAYLGFSGQPPDKESISASLLKQGLREIMREDGANAAPLLIELAQSGNAFEKSSAVDALGYGLDIDLSLQMLDHFMTGNSGLTGRQISYILSDMLKNPVTRQSSWAWLKANFEPYLTTHVADIRKHSVPQIFQGCSLEQADDAEQFFNSQAGLITGYESRLAQKIEQVKNCSALRQQRAADLALALGQY